MFTIPKTLTNRFDINANNVFATNISGHNIWAINISSASAFVNNMTIGTLNITDSSTLPELIAERSTMENVRITHNTTINLHASYATIPNLLTTNVTFLNITNNYETVSNVSFNNIIFTNATGTNLIATNISSDNIDASSIDTATLIATNLTANSLRFNNVVSNGSLYFSQGNLIIGIDNKTIKLDEAKRELYSDSLSFIKGYDPIDIWTADNLASFLGISLISLATLLGLPENLLPSFIFVRLNYDDVFFTTSAGKLTLTGGIENGQILFRDNNALNGMDDLRADIVSGTTTISNLRSSDCKIDFGTFGNLDILSIDYCSQAFLDGNSTINNGYLNNATIENLRLDNSTMNNLDVLNIYTSQLFVDGNGTINNLSVGDLEVTNLTVQNIKHNGSATLNNLDVLSATILETRLDGFSTIVNTKILEADVNYIDGDDIYFSNSTFTNIRNSFATLGNVDILSIDSCSRAFIDGQATINNIRGSDITMQNFYGGRFFTSNQTPSENDELASKKYVDDKALRDLTEGDGININNGTISIDIASTPVLGAINISTIPIFGTKLINLDPIYKGAVDQVIVANTIPIPNFLYTGLTNQLFIYLYIGVSVTLVTVTASISGLTATVETLRSVIDNTNGDVYNLTAGGALMINPNKTINFNAISVNGGSNGVERFRIGENFKIYEHSNVDTGAKILFNSAYIGVIDSAGAGIAFPNGNIGIGTTTPNYKLDVNGNIGAHAITTGALSATTLTAGTVLFTTLSAGTISANTISVANLIALNETVVNLLTTNETILNLIIVDDLLVTDLSSSNANLTNLTATNISVVNVSSASAFVNSMTIGTLHITDSSTFENIDIEKLIAERTTMANVVITRGTASNFRITNSTINNLHGTHGHIDNITSTNLRAVYATIPNLLTTTLTAGTVLLTTLSAGSANISNLNTTNLTVGTFKSTNISATNISTSSLITAEATIANIFTTGGNVGIANTAPSYDLDVTGDVNFTGTLYQNGTPFSGGGSSQWTGSVGSAISYTSGTVIASNVSVANITVTNVLATNQTITGGLLITGGSLKATANDNTIGPITTTFTTTTFANLVPITSGLFAYYNGSSWTGSQWSDLTTNGNHATTIGGTINTTTENSITYLYGNTSARMRFPTSVLPSTYTLFHVAKYNGSTRQRIFDGVTNNWLSGFWSNNSGIAYHNQGWLGPSSGVAGSNNFLLSSDQKGLYRANGSVVGTGSGDSTHLSIMDGGHASENSDWAISEIIVYNRELTTDEIERTESWLMDKYSAFTFTTSLTRSATHTAGTVTLGTYGNVSLNVGISNTAPSYTLDVNGDLNFTGDLYQNGTLFGGGSSQWTGSVGSAISYTSGTVIASAVSVANIIATNQTITGTLTATTATIGSIITNSGNVGIGTGSPSSTLTIYTPSSTTFNIQSSSANTKIYSHVDTRTYFQSLGDIIFAGIDSDQLRHLCLRTNGNVGIGTTTPGYRLDVDGDISLRGTQSAPDFIYANGAGDNSCVNIRAGSSSDVWSQIQVQGHWNGSSNTAGNVSFYTRGVQRMRITDAGDVGIGTASPSHKLSIDSGSKTNGSVYLTNTAGGGVINFYDENHAIWGRRGFGGGNDVIEFHEYGSISFWTGGVLSNQKSRLSILNSDNIVFQFQQDGIDWKTDLYYDGDAYCFAFNYSNGPVSTGGYGAYGVKGFIDPFYNNVRLNFTGQHRSNFKDLDVSEINNYVGLIVRSIGKYMSMNNEEMLSVGKDAISINESLPIVELTTTYKDKAVFGVISNAEEPTKPRTDKFGCWGTPYSKESGDNRVFVNGVGEGALWVSNKNGDLENGDYITTSTIPGYGERQLEEYIANYTVAKITMDCDFNPQLQPKLQPQKDILGNNVLDSKGNIIWEESGEYEKEYDIRYIDEDGNILTSEDYDSNIHYISAFVGCTYHCS